MEAAIVPEKNVTEETIRSLNRKVRKGFAKVRKEALSLRALANTLRPLRFPSLIFESLLVLIEARSNMQFVR